MGDGEEIGPEGLDALMRALGFTRASDIVNEMRQAHDQVDMTLEQATQRIRLFIEQLNDEQLSDLAWLLGLFASQKYLVHVVRGVCVAEHWRRDPLRAADATKPE